MRLLAARGRSEQDLCDRLRLKGFSAVDVEEARRRLRELGYLDDAGLARGQAEQLASLGSARDLVRHKLSSKGFAPSLIEELVATLPDDRTLARLALERRFGERSFEAAQAVRFLARRGFDVELAAELVGGG